MMIKSPDLPTVPRAKHRESISDEQPCFMVQADFFELTLKYNLTR